MDYEGPFLSSLKPELSFVFASVFCYSVFLLPSLPAALCFLPHWDRHGFCIVISTSQAQSQRSKKNVAMQLKSRAKVRLGVNGLHRKGNPKNTLLML